MEYHLHDDFYDEDGIAGQPVHDVIDAHLYPVPTLDDVRADLPALLDFLLTRWHIRDEHAAALRQHSASAVLALAQKRFRRTQNSSHHYAYIESAAIAAGTNAQEWILSVLPANDTKLQLAMLSVGLQGIEPRLAFDLITAKWESLPPPDRKHPPFDLARLGDPRALAWIQANIREPIVNSWGEVAAACGCNWAAVREWLMAGRPMHLVALDVLIARCSPRATYLWKIAKRPAFGPIDPDDLKMALRVVLANDPVPRVEEQVRYIFQHLNEVIN